MLRTMLKSKIHRATVTGAELDYQGSLTVDTDLLEKADLLVGEQVHVLNVNNGQRFITYTIPGPAGSGTIILNGPCARLGNTGDEILIISYAQFSDEEAAKHEPVVVLVDKNNRPC